MRRTYRVYILYERMAPAVNPADRRSTFGWKMDTGVSFFSSDMKHAMEMRRKQDASDGIYESRSCHTRDGLIFAKLCKLIVIDF